MAKPKNTKNRSRDAQVDWYFSRPAFQCNPNEKIVKCVEQAYPNVNQIGWGIWTDAAIFQQAGIPTVNIGPMGFGLHEPVESVDIDSVKQTANILFEAANIFFKQDSIGLWFLIIVLFW